MLSKYRVRRARSAAATLVVAGVAVLVMGCAAALAREPSSVGVPAPSASVGLLARGAGYDQVTGSQRVRALQSKLRRLRHDPGPIDGLFGPRTEAAVRGFQQSRGLAMDGIVGEATAAALRPASRGVRQSDGGRRTAGSSPARSAAQHRRPLQTGQERGVSEPAAQPTRSKPVSDSGSVNAPLAALVLALGALVALTVVLFHRRRRAARATPGSIVRASRARIGEFKGRILAIVARARPSRSAGRGWTTWRLRLGALRVRIRAIGSRLLRSGWGRRRRATSSVPDDAGWLSSRADPGTDRPVERRVANGNGGPSKRRAGEPAPLRALGYLSGETAAELGTQAEQIEQLCDRRGWMLVELVRASEANGDGTLASSGALEHALERLRGGEVSVLVVAQLEPVCRAAGGRETLLERLDQVGARLVCVQPALDTAAAPTARERPSRRQFVGAYRPGEKVGLECFQLGRIRGGRSEAVWQYTAVDYASGYAWAELRISEREARTEHLREFVQRVARELRAAGWRLESVSSENASALSTGQSRGGPNRLGSGRGVNGERPASNGHVERLQRKIIAECWRPALARSRQGSLSALQRQLDDYLEAYNRTETSGPSRGRVPEEMLAIGTRNGSSEHSANGSGRAVGHDRASRP